jgi:MFS family permease
METDSDRPYWWQFFFLSVGYCAFTVCRIGFPVGLSAMGKQFAWTTFEVGVLSTVFLLGQALIDIPAGYWADRLDRKRMLCGGIIGIGLFTILITFSTNFMSALVYRVLFGVMEGIYNIVAFAVAGSILPGNRAFVNGLTQVSYGVGNYTGQTVVGSLLRAHPGFWQLPLYWLGGATMAYGVLSFALFKRQYLRRYETKNEMTQYGLWRTLGQVVQNRRVWKAVAIHACNIIPTWAILGMGNYVFIEYRHYDPSFSASVFGIGYGVGSLFVPLGTVWADRFGRRPVVCALGIWTAASTFLLFNVVSPNWTMIALCICAAFGINALYTLGYTITQDAVASASMSGIGIATGIAGGFGYLFSMLGGPLVGAFIPILGPLWAMNLVVSGGQLLLIIFAFWFLSNDPLPRLSAHASKLSADPHLTTVSYPIRE